ncbi:MAG: hypothetical protein U0987_05920 [Afipia sp.]|nr:hypothetical protein [Afipia sp.]
MPVDLTSPWIPLGIIMVLGLFMFRQFLGERRESRELALAEAAAEAAPKTNVAPPAPLGTAPKSEKKKRKLRWRTAWIWMPFLIGFFGQAYLSFIKPMVDNAAG